MAISKETLLKGRKRTKEVPLDGGDFVIIRSLTSGEITSLNNKYADNQEELSIQMISISLVEPQLTPDEVRELEVTDFTTISEAVVELIGGKKPEEIEEEVKQFRQDN